MNEELIATIEQKANDKMDAVLRWRKQDLIGTNAYFYGVAMGGAIAYMDTIWDAITTTPDCLAVAAWNRLNDRARLEGIRL